MEITVTKGVAAGTSQPLHGSARIPELDGVRAFAVWLVMLAHLIVPDDHAMQVMAGFIPHPLLVILSHGWMGVDLFFALSGFLITGILLKSKSSPGYFRNFYIRRIFRIFPLYFGTILVFWLFYGHGAYFLLSLFFLANMASFFHVGVPHGPSLYWSLAVEEHFYLVWPLIVRFLSRTWLTVLCLAICVAEPAVRIMTNAAGLDYYVLTWCRLDGLATGAVLAIWFRSERATKRNSLILAGAMLCALLLITAAGMPFGINGTRNPVSVGFRGTQGNLAFGAFLCAAYALRSSQWTAFLRLRFLTLSGELSYCLYLVHLSVADGYDFLFTKALGLPVLTPREGMFLRAFCVAAVSWLLAVLSNRYFEGPILARKERFTVRA
ncbi:MAG: acyltransferase [Acidobacteriota bacterium]